eukprot:13214778-Alexandrium_andersonii.AAC.1
MSFGKLVTKAALEEVLRRNRQSWPKDLKEGDDSVWVETMCSRMRSGCYIISQAMSKGKSPKWLDRLWESQARSLRAAPSQLRQPRP